MMGLNDEELELGFSLAVHSGNRLVYPAVY
jgi:hypothetical protein